MEAPDRSLGIHTVAWVVAWLESSGMKHLRLIYPHQLHAAQLQVEKDTRLVVVEDDLLYRQLPFHAHKLVLHRASAGRFVDRARDTGLDVDVVESRADRTSGQGLVELVERLRPEKITVLDVVDDWLGRDCRDQLREGGHELRHEDVLETPAFLTTRAQVAEQLGDGPARMQSSYAWQRRRLVDERLGQFGPYEDAISVEHPVVFHSAISPALNCGLIDPDQVLERVLVAAEEQDVELASLEGFVRQLIGWREYMRGTYRLHGRRMRTSNVLGHARGIPPGWWDGTTGLEPVDLVIRRVIERGWAHHIERLMVLGNALCLLRVDPEEVWRWFMVMFVDAYDWVMVPNVYAMSQFAAGEAITTKPYVSGSNYLRKMSDLPVGEWREVWDGLYWTFVEDHREVFEANPRSGFAVRTLEGIDGAKRAAHREAAAPWLGR